MTLTDCPSASSLQVCTVVLQLPRELHDHNVSAAVTEVLQHHDGLVAFDGRVARIGGRRIPTVCAGQEKNTLFDFVTSRFVSAATCGNSTTNGTLDEALAWCGVDLAPGTFCTTAQQHDIPSWFVSSLEQSFTKARVRGSILTRPFSPSQSEWKESPAATAAVLHRGPIHHCRPKYCSDNATKHHICKCNFIPDQHNNRIPECHHHHLLEHHHHL